MVRLLVRRTYSWDKSEGRAARQGAVVVALDEQSSECAPGDGATLTLGGGGRVGRWFGSYQNKRPFRKVF